MFKRTKKPYTTLPFGVDTPFFEKAQCYCLLEMFVIINLGSGQMRGWKGSAGFDALTG